MRRLTRRSHLAAFSLVVVVVLHIYDLSLPRASEHTMHRSQHHILLVSAVLLLHRENVLGGWGLPFQNNDAGGGGSEDNS